MNNSFVRHPLMEQLEQLELLKTIVTFLTVLEFRTVKHPYIGVDLSISKNVELKKSTIRTVGQLLNEAGGGK